jgi:hypothetical protein
MRFSLFTLLKKIIRFFIFIVKSDIKDLLLPTLKIRLFGQKLVRWNERAPSNKRGDLLKNMNS